MLSAVTAYTMVDEPKGGQATTPLFDGPDSLCRTRRHSRAVQRLAIYRDTVEARKIWSELIAEDGSYAPALYYMSLTAAERSTERLEYARRAFVADTTNKWYVQNYAQNLLGSRNYDEALPIYKRLLRLDNRDISTYYSLAILYNYSRMPYTAVAILDSADMRLGRNSYLSQFKQRLLLDMGQYDRAIEEGQKTIRELPYDVEAYSMLAMAYEVAGRDSLAQATLLQGFAIDSTRVELLEEIVDYYYRHNDTENLFKYEEYLTRSDKLSCEEKLHRIGQYTVDTRFYAANFYRMGKLIHLLTIQYPENSGVKDMYATHLVAAGNSEEALEYLRRHLDDATTRAEDYITMLQLELFMECDDHLLLGDIARAIERFPEDIALNSMVGFIFSEKGLYDEARDIFRGMLKFASTNEERSQLWGYIGDVYHEEGKDNAAFSAYDKALGYNENNVLVLNNYAYFLSLKHKRLDYALRLITQAIGIESNNASYMDTYAWVLHLLGRNEEAKKAMRTAISLGGQRNPDFMAHYGDILWALGEAFLAEAYWDKAVEYGYDEAEMKAHRQKIQTSKKRP